MREKQFEEQTGSFLAGAISPRELSVGSARLKSERGSVFRSEGNSTPAKPNVRSALNDSQPQYGFLKRMALDMQRRAFQSSQLSQHQKSSNFLDMLQNTPAKDGLSMTIGTLKESQNLEPSLQKS